MAALPFKTAFELTRSRVPGKRCSTYFYLKIIPSVADQNCDGMSPDHP